jgi:hypothetical protein
MSIQRNIRKKEHIHARIKKERSIQRKGRKKEKSINKQE